MRFRYSNFGAVSTPAPKTQSGQPGLVPDQATIDADYQKAVNAANAKASQCSANTCIPPWTVDHNLVNLAKCQTACLAQLAADIAAADAAKQAAMGDLQAAADSAALAARNQKTADDLAAQSKAAHDATGCDVPTQTGNPYDDVKCYAKPKCGDSAGNANWCTDHDFTEYDIVGALPQAGAGAWWNLFDQPANDHMGPPRSEYCGPIRDAPYMGDEPVQGLTPAQIALVLPDGGTLYHGAKGAYVVGGKSFCRNNPKDWHKEEYYELLFLGRMKLYLDDGKTDDAAMLMHNFIMYKSTRKNQWVTKVPGFFDVGNAGIINNRHEYVIARKILDVQSGKYIYFYLPSYLKAGFVEQYKTGGGWNYSAQGEYGTPDNVVEPGEDPSCEVDATLIAVVQAFKVVFDLATFNGSSLVNWQTYVNIVKGIVVRSAIENKVDVQASDFDVVGFESAINDLKTFAASVQKCIIMAEYKLETGGLFPDDVIFKAAVESALPQDWLDCIAKGDLFDIAGNCVNPANVDCDNAGGHLNAAGKCIKNTAGGAKTAKLVGGEKFNPNAPPPAATDSNSNGLLLALAALAGVAWISRK